MFNKDLNVNDTFCMLLRMMRKFCFMKSANLNFNFFSSLQSRKRIFDDEKFLIRTFYTMISIHCSDATVRSD